MKKLNFILCTVFLFIQFSLHAQKFKVENIELDDRENFIDNVFPFENGYVRIHKAGDRTVELRALDATTAKISKRSRWSISLQRLDKKFNVLDEKKLYNGKEVFTPSILIFKKLNDRYFIICQTSNEKNVLGEVKAIEFNPKTLELIGENNITDGTHENLPEEWLEKDLYYELVESPDKSKILFFVFLKNKDDKKFQMQMTVIDNKMEFLWSRFEILPYTEKEFEILDKYVDNNGWVYIHHKTNGGIFNDKSEVKQSTTQGYTYNVTFYKNKYEDPIVYSIDMKGKYIEQSFLIYDVTTKNLMAVGTYCNNNNGILNGVIQSSVSGSATPTLNATITEFPLNIIKLFKEDDIAEVKEKKYGLSKFFFGKKIMREDGSYDIILEHQYYEYYRHTSTATRMTYVRKRFYCNGVLDVHFSSKGIIFSRLPKETLAEETDIALSFYPIAFKDKLILIYNDHEDNETRDINEKPKKAINIGSAVIMAAIINHDGTILRRVLLKYGEEGRKVAAISYPVSNEKFQVTFPRMGWMIFSIKVKEFVTIKVTD